MSQMSELAVTIEELRKTAQMLTGIADNLTEMFSTSESIDDYEEIYTPVTFEELRSKLSEYSRKGHTADIKAILRKYGAERISELKTDDYDAVMQEAEQYAN